MKKNILEKLIITFFFLSFIKSFYGDQVIEKIVARINGEIITLSELNDFYKTYKKRSSAGRKLNKKKLLDLLIDTEILFQIARERHLEVSEKEIQTEIKRYQSKLGVMTHQAFLSALKKQGISSLEILRFEIKKAKTQNYLISHLIRNHFIKEPTEEEINQTYKENRDQFNEKEKVKISHIIIKMSNDESYTKIKSKEKDAKNILLLIRTGKEDFESLAKKYSDDRDTKYRGGLLGWYDENVLSQITPKYAETAFSLKNGEVSDLIWTSLGIHIIKVLDKRKERKIPFSEAKRYIHQNLIKERGQKKLFSLIKIKKKRSIIEIFL